MDPQEIANLFSGLRDGELAGLRLEEGDLQFQVLLPKLAAMRGEGFLRFLCRVGKAQGISLQPFRNESVEIRDLNQVNRLQLRIERAEVTEGGWVRVYCAHRGSQSGARLSLRGEEMQVWDEAFDPVTSADLGILRGKAAGK